MFRKAMTAALAVVSTTMLAVAAPVAARAEEPETCSLAPNPHGSEWLSCVSVAASLATLPAVGDTATLTFEVTAEHDRPDIRINADLPIGLQWDQPPDGMTARDEASPDPADRGLLHRATGMVTVHSGQTARFTGTVVATAAGPADVAVRVFSALDREANAPTDHVYLTVAERGGVSTPGMAGSPEGEAGPGRPGATRSAPNLPHKPVRTVTGSGARASAPLAGDACVVGSWGYTDNAGIERVAPNYTVEVWDKDTFSTNDLIATLLTGANGEYGVCFDNEDVDGGLLDGGQDVFVRFMSTNLNWRVQETGTGNLFSENSAVAANLPTTPNPHSFGFRKPVNPNHHLAVQAFDAANDLWSWLPGECWDADDPADLCKQIVIVWRWDSPDKPGYDFANKLVRLGAADPKNYDMAVHEVTHAVMDDVYDGVFVPGSNVEHLFWLKSNPGSAWVEGFAEWTPTQVYDEPSFNWPDGNVLNLETLNWSIINYERGDQVETRVAAALLDLSDATNEGPWDRLAEGRDNIWATLLAVKSDNFADFWAQRGALGFNVSPSGGLASLYQNTIDYVFRDPLSNNIPVTRPTSPDPHNFSYNTTTKFWSVVAVKPPAGANYDLRLFDNKAQSVQKAVSNVANSLIDFVAVDSNTGFEPLGDFYPRATGVSGFGNCIVELAQGSTILPVATAQNIVMVTGKVVAVRDTNLTSGVPVTIKVTPANSTQDAELFVVRSTAAQHFQTRVSAFKFSGATGPGGVETISFTPTASGWYGVVLINKSGSGAYTLQRS